MITKVNTDYYPVEEQIDVKPDSAVVIDLTKDFARDEPEKNLASKREPHTSFQRRTPSKDTLLHSLLSVLPQRTPSPVPPFSTKAPVPSNSASMLRRRHRESDQAVPFNNQVTGRPTPTSAPSFDCALEPDSEFPNLEVRDGAKTPEQQEFSLWIRDPQEQLQMKQQWIPPAPNFSCDPRRSSNSLAHGNPLQGQLPFHATSYFDSYNLQNRNTSEMPSRYRHYNEEPMEGVEFEVSPLKRSRSEFNSMKSTASGFKLADFDVARTIGQTCSSRADPSYTNAHFYSTDSRTPRSSLPLPASPPIPSAPTQRSTLVTFTQDMTPTRKGALKLKW